MNKHLISNKVYEKLSPEEKARLVISDQEKGIYEGKSFLSPQELETIMSFKDWESSKRYNKCLATKQIASFFMPEYEKNYLEILVFYYLLERRNLRKMILGKEFVEDKPSISQIREIVRKKTAVFLAFKEVLDILSEEYGASVMVEAEEKDMQDNLAFIRSFELRLAKECKDKDYKETEANPETKADLLNVKNKFIDLALN